MSCTIPSSPAGMGTEASPYVLLNYAHLKTMGNALNKHYKLGATIDARDSWNEGAMGCTAYAGDATLPTGTPCTGWVPVGDNSDGTDATRFTGSLDGNGYTIMNLYAYVKATSGATFTGLFGMTGGSAEIKNLGLKGIYVNVSNTSTTESYVGGLVGLVNSGTIVNTYAAGEINVSAQADGFRGGGLLGVNGGTLINSYVQAKVSVSSASNSNSGGLVGENNGGTIINSYATGEVTSRCTRHALQIFGGGLVGLNGSVAGTMIKNSYATGNVSLSCSGGIISDLGGGLVGENKQTIENSYATGRVACIAGEMCNNPKFGGLVGSNVASDGGTISGTNYFVFNAAGTDDDDGVGSGACAMGATCAVRTLAQLQALNEGTALGWNTTVWDVSTTAPAKLKYVAGFCSNPAHTTQAACTTASATWRAVAACETIASNDKAVNQGAQLPDCGDLIAGQ